MNLSGKLEIVIQLLRILSQETLNHRLSNGIIISYFKITLNKRFDDYKIELLFCFLSF